VQYCRGEAPYDRGGGGGADSQYCSPDEHCAVAEWTGPYAAVGSIGIARVPQTCPCTWLGVTQTVGHGGGSHACAGAGAAAAACDAEHEYAYGGRCGAESGAG
jgi:hypothetical protein